MILSTEKFKIEMYSNFINQLIEEEKFKLNGVVLENDNFLFEFEAFIEGEEIVFDAYYDLKHHLRKIHVDEDYQRSFKAYFNEIELAQVKIELIV